MYCGICDTVPVKSYGTLVREARTDKKWSQARLAREIGVDHPTTVHRIETDVMRPPVLVASRIEDVLKIDPEPLVDARYEADCSEYGVKPRWKR